MRSYLHRTVASSHHLRHTLGAVSLLSWAAACSDGTEYSTLPIRSDNGGGGGQASAILDAGVASGAGAQALDAGGGDAATAIEGDVFRPEVRAATPALVAGL